MWNFNESLEKLLINNDFVNLDLILNNKNNNFSANIGFFSSDLSNLPDNQLLKYLSKDEFEDYKNLKNDFLRKKFLNSNICAKYAISQIIKIDNLSQITIKRGIFGQPYIICNNLQNFDISIANKIINNKNISCAIIFKKKFPMAIDLENINNSNLQQITSQMTMFEIINFAKNDQNLIYLWSAKEAISKVTLCGLYADFKIFEISKMIKNDYYIECYFKNFSQYKSYSKIINNILITIICHKDYNILNH